MDLGLSGKACIVTGATSGIGAEVTRMLLAEGAQVLLVARDQARLDAVAAAHGGAAAPGGAAAHGGAAANAGAAAHARAVPCEADVTDPDAAGRIVAACESAFGRVDVLVNNAGTSDVMPLDGLTDEEWELQWQLNVLGPMRLMRAVAPQMAEREWGRIVNIASSAGKRPSQRNAAYTVTKAAELSLSRLYADAWAGKGVLVNAVAPGPTATELWTAEGGLADQHARLAGSSREDELEGAAAKVPIGRLGTPEEIASVVVFLCSEAASNVAGASWSVDGGAVPFFI